MSSPPIIISDTPSDITEIGLPVTPPLLCIGVVIQAASFEPLYILRLKSFYPLVII